MVNINRRVRIVRDDEGDIPEDELHVPVVWLPYNGRGAAGVMGAEYLPDADHIRRACLSLGWEGTIRWFRAFYGPVHVLRSDNRYGVYVTVVTDAWRAELGLLDYYLAATGQPLDTLGMECDFQHYLNGEVYNLIPETFVHWVRFYPDEEGGDVDYDDQISRWEQDYDEEGYGGVYGGDVAVTLASEDFFSGLDFDVIGPGGDVAREVRV